MVVLEVQSASGINVLVVYVRYICILTEFRRFG